MFVFIKNNFNKLSYLLQKITYGRTKIEKLFLRMFREIELIASQDRIKNISLAEPTV